MNMNLSSKKITNFPLADHQIGIWYLGQEGFLFKNGSNHLVVDPYLSDYVDKNCCEYVKWERLYEPPMKPEELDFVDVVVCTHSHYDHADPETLAAVAKSNPRTKFIIPAPVKNVLESYGINKDNIIPAYAGQEIQVANFTVIPVPSAHEELHTDADGNFCELGYIIKADEQTFFHAGDMCLYDGLIENLRQYTIDIAFLPINGRDYFRNKNDIIGNFTAAEAVLLAKEIHAEMLVPMHHDLYKVNCVKTEEFVSYLNEYHPFRKYHVFSPAEGYISVKQV